MAHYGKVVILLNFYEEMNRQFKAAGLSARFVKDDSAMFPTAKDIAELERKIALRIAKNDNMLALSQIYAEYHSLPVQ